MATVPNAETSCTPYLSTSNPQGNTLRPSAGSGSPYEYPGAPEVEPMPTAAHRDWLLRTGDEENQLGRRTCVVGSCLSAIFGCVCESGAPFGIPSDKDHRLSRLLLGPPIYGSPCVRVSKMPGFQFEVSWGLALMILV